MADLDDEEEAKLTSIIEKVTFCASDIIRSAREDVQVSTENFVSNKIGQLFKIVSLFKDTFEILGVQNRDGFERKIRHNFRITKIREAYDDLLNAEQEWDDFLKAIDDEMNSNVSAMLHVGDSGPITESLYDAQTNEPTNLKSFLSGDDFLLLVLLRHFA